jgi:hypothetical protein
MDNRTLDEIRNDLVKSISAVRDELTGYNFSPDVNDPSDLLAVIINDIALQIQDKNEQLLRLRSALNPFKATGRELRDVIEYRGLTAKSGTPSTAVAVFTGLTPGVLMPAETVLSNDDETKLFITENDLTAESEEPVSVKIHSQQIGSILLSANELTKILPPIPGLSFDSLTAQNILIGSTGETDKDIHLRLEQSSGSDGAGFLDVMDTALMNIDGVKSAAAYVGPDHDIALYTLCCVVSGGDDTEVARTIFEKNMFLMKYSGNTSVDIKSEFFGRTYVVTFWRPTQQVLKISVKIRGTDNLPDDIDGEILADVSRFLQQFGAGSTLYSADLLSFINESNGIYKMLTAEFTGGSDGYVKLDWNKIASTDAENLTIEHVDF